MTWAPGMTWGLAGHVFWVGVMVAFYQLMARGNAGDNAWQLCAANPCALFQYNDPFSLSQSSLKSFK